MLPDASALSALATVLAVVVLGLLAGGAVNLWGAVARRASGAPREEPAPVPRPPDERARR